MAPERLKRNIPLLEVLSKAHALSGTELRRD